MNTDKKKSSSHFIGVYLCSSVVLFFAGCGSPNQANIELRKQNQQLTSEVDQLKREKERNLAAIASLEQAKGTLQTLPNDRLDKMFVAGGISLGRLSGGADLDPEKPGDDGLKVYVVPVDQSGEPIKSAGSFVVEAFDLSNGGTPLVGRWEFPLDGIERYWYGRAMLYTYVLPCPWQNIVPTKPELTLKVTFKDELTQRSFTAQKVVTIRPPTPATQPAAVQ